MDIPVGVPIIMTANIHNDIVEIVGKPIIYNNECYYYMCGLEDDCIEEGWYKNGIIQPDFYPEE